MDHKVVCYTSALSESKRSVAERNHASAWLHHPFVVFCLGATPRKGKDNEKGPRTRFEVLFAERRLGQHRLHQFVSEQEMHLTVGVIEFVG